MINFKTGNNTFNFRVAGLAIHQNKVLIHRMKTQDFWSLPGGRVEMQQDTIATLKREFQEELEETIEVERLLWVAESFFEHKGRAVHEICFYYKINFQENAQVLDQHEPFERLEIDGEFLVFKWIPLEKLKVCDFYPIFIRNNILKLPHQVQHIIDRA